jgi:two-component system, chemotaxis family, response regulator Rcp1
VNILLIEDNPADMRLVREALAEGDGPAVQLHWSPSGEAGLAHLRGLPSAALPDLVLLDLNLPGLHGHEVLQDIKRDARLRHLPVLVLSSSAAPSDVHGAYAAHANAYLIKPDDFSRFVALVGSIRSHWLGAVMLPGRV